MELQNDVVQATLPKQHAVFLLVEYDFGDRPVKKPFYWVFSTDVITFMVAGLHYGGLIYPCGEVVDGEAETDAACRIAKIQLGLIVTCDDLDYVGSFDGETRDFRGRIQSQLVVGAYRYKGKLHRRDLVPLDNMPTIGVSLDHMTDASVASLWKINTMIAAKRL